MIKGILWDVDDTVFDYTGADRVAVLAHFTAEGLTCDDVALARWNELMDAAYARFTSGEVSFVEQRRIRVRHYLGEQAGEAECDAWFARYLDRFEGAWRGFDDVVPALDLLTDYRHGIVSNSTAPLQERKLRGLGLWDRFETVVCSDEHGAAKPDRTIFLAGCAGLGLRPSETVYVGDKLALDGVGARDAGLHGVWLDRAGTGITPPPGVHRITGLAEFPALVERLRRGEDGR